jgi:ribosome-associated heat shock protein Hsp15
MTERGDSKETLRLDKWLWHARIVKTRSLAAQLVTQGKCRVNREKVVKPAFAIKSGDVITAAIHNRVRVLQIVACGARRGPANEAQMLYIDLTPPPADPRTAGPGEEDPQPQLRKVRQLAHKK